LAVSVSGASSRARQYQKTVESNKPASGHQLRSERDKLSDCGDSDANEHDERRFCVGG
jgi:hypothetical protein